MASCQAPSAGEPAVLDRCTAAWMALPAAQRMASSSVCSQGLVYGSQGRQGSLQRGMADQRIWARSDAVLAQRIP